MIPELRFSDVWDIWLVAAERNGVRYACCDAKQALHYYHKLNMCRAAVRDSNPIHLWDAFIVRVDGANVVITRKVGLDRSRFVDLEGAPIAPADVEEIINPTLIGPRPGVLSPDDAIRAATAEIAAITRAHAVAPVDPPDGPLRLTDNE